MQSPPFNLLSTLSFPLSVSHPYHTLGRQGPQGIPGLCIQWPQHPTSRNLTSPFPIATGGSSNQVKAGIWHPTPRGACAKLCRGLAKGQLSRCLCCGICNCISAAKSPGASKAGSGVYSSHLRNNEVPGATASGCKSFPSNRSSKL